MAGISNILYVRWLSILSAGALTKRSRRPYGSWLQILVGNDNVLMRLVATTSDLMYCLYCPPKRSGARILCFVICVILEYYLANIVTQSVTHTYYDHWSATIIIVHSWRYPNGFIQKHVCPELSDACSGHVITIRHHNDQDSLSIDVLVLWQACV